MALNDTAGADRYDIPIAIETDITGPESLHEPASLLIRDLFLSWIAEGPDSYPDRAYSSKKAP